MIELRNIVDSDVEKMLEWMHDDDINACFVKDFASMDKQDVVKFINGKNENDIHLAISEQGEYLGTVSLKNIDGVSAEYAIALRQKCIGKGVAKHATMLILHKAFYELSLEKVYLNVLEQNERAQRFYKKMGFRFEGMLNNYAYVRGEWKNLCFYAMLADDFNGRPVRERARRLEFKQLGDDRGRLVVFESMQDIPFEIKRVFYIYGSDAEVVRGKHANRMSSFVLINVAGTSKVMVDYGDSKEIFELNKPRIGVYIPPMLWKEMYEFSKDSVLLVISDMHYDPSEYISDKQKYLDEIGIKP